ncbi:MAG: peptidoglycan-binding protein, partial [Clostridia bacterium]|nr:peptidoglycan-binding protein [Clostridia bacterium]
FSSSVNYYDVYHVKFIQLAMNDLQSAGLYVDGIFGSATATAVKSFQTANGLDVDGIVGSGSWNKMLELLAAKYSAPQVETYSVSGSVTSFGDSSAATDIALLSGSTQIDCVSTASGSYLLSDIAAGTYTLSVSKANHVTREYYLTVSGDTVQDVTICLVGDVTCDGDVTTRDLNRIYAHVSEISPLTGYDLACADIVGSDGEATTRDLNRIYAHVSEISPLW